MKPGVPWSIKGVEPELREVAKSAARRSGMTLGEWLNSAINEQAEGNPGDPVESGASAMRAGLISTHPIERAATKLEDIALQLSRLAAREGDSAYRAPTPTADEQFAAAKILARVEQNEKQTVEAFSAVNERLATISRQITRSQAAPAPAKVEESPGFQALEKAVRNIVEHLEVSDRRTRDNMKTLQERMSEMATRANSSNNDLMLKQAPAFSQLENRLAELAQRMEQNARMPAQASNTDQLRDELNQLAGRIDKVRETSEALASKAQTQAVQTAQAELRNIEGRILGLVNEAKQSISSQQVGPAELQRFRQEIDKINARVDEAAKASSKDQDISALRVAVEQLSTRVAQGQDPRPLAELDRRVLEIARKVEQAEAATRNLPQMNDLERRFAELDQRLQSNLQNPSMHGQEELTQKLVEVDERLARTEHQLGHLETIERAITQLYDAIETNRKATHDIAHDAANRMAQQLAAQGSGAAVDLASAPEIIALQSGLHAVRQASEASDHRNQETLEAVHETLEQIVSKLSELETAAIGHRVAQAAAPADPAPVFTPAPAMPAPEPMAVAAEPASNPFAAAPNPMAQAPLPQANELFTAERNEENFMDPLFAGNDLAQETAAPAAAVENPFAAAPAAASAASGSEANINDWVAAARNLAQSSAEARNPISGYKPGAQKPKQAGRGLNLPFLSKRSKKPSAAEALPPVAGTEKPAQSGSRLRLIALGILLLGLATFSTTNYFGRMHSDVAPAPVPAATEQAAPQATPEAPQAAPTAPAAVAPAVEPAPIAPDDKAKQAQPQQQGDAGPTPNAESDPILTGALPTGKPFAPDAAQPNKAIASANVTIDSAVGPTKLRQAAQSGDANAQFIIASHYLNGDTVANDYGKAAYWYGKAAAQGLAPAQYRLGTLYERGKGVDKNLQAAEQWYERAGALGNVKAMHNAAVIAAGTEAGQPDYAKAYKWFSLAAGHGLKDSQYNLAVLIERGLGTKQDTSEAFFWYLAAASQSDSDAQARVDVLSKTLSASTVDAVKAKFKAWSPDKAPEAANSVAVNDAQWNPGQQSSLLPAAVAPPANINDQAKVLLDKLGYRVGQMDGNLDAKTANAIKLFQIQHGLKVTGQATLEVINAMQAKAG